MFKRAFTLTELLIALAIIGILSAVLYPIIVHILPDRNVVMAKRAFYTTETIVADMINNRYCYPDLTSNKTDPRVGFDDGSGYSRCVYGRTQENDALKKFATLFTDKLDIKTISDDKQSFTTKDGLVWTITSPTETENILNFQDTKNKKLAHIIITVDTNGTKKDPNCGQSSYSPACASNNKKSYDKFSMRVFATGKIQVLDCWAVKAIQVSKDLNNKNSTGNEKDTGAICAELGEPDPEPAVCNVEPSVYTDVCCEDEKWSSSANCQVPEENDCDCSLHPNGPSDDCCDIEKCPHSEWTETAYCGNCYPLDTSSASSCCDTWYANSSIFGNFGSKDEDEKTQACCNVSSFSSSHSSEGDVCYIEPASPDLKQYTATWDIKMSPTLTYNPSFVDSYSITGNFRDDYIVYIHAVYEYSNYPRGYTRGAHVISNNDKETNTFIAYASDTRYTGKDAIFHYTSNTVNAYTDGPYASDYRVESFNDTGSRCIIYIYNKKTEMLTQLYPSDNGYPCHWNSDDDLWHDDDDLYICEHNRFRHCSGTITWTENDY